MFWLYFLAIIPIAVGLVVKQINKKVNWLEYGIGCILALVSAGACNAWAYYSQINDYETRSGSIVQARQFSAWKEYYEYAVYRTEYYTATESYSDSKGRLRSRTVTKSRQVFSHWQPSSRWHNENWEMYSNIDTTHSITKDYYIQTVKNFGGDVPVKGKRTTSDHNSRMIGGDPNDYVADNKTQYIIPVNKKSHFENHVRSSNSIFKKRTLSEAEKKPLFPYPEHFDWFVSNRLMGTAVNYTSKESWEKVNAVLGPIKKINLICIGYPDGTDSTVFDNQIALWQGGKKNDFVIGFSKGWARVFSWSDSELAKIRVEELFLNPNSPTLLEDLKRIITQDYRIVNWEEKFKHLSITPQTHHFVVYLIVLFLTQAVLYFIFHRYDITFE